MFDIGWTELLVIGIVALIVVGPKDLPGMFRTLGRFTARAKSMGREFTRAMDEAARDSGVKDVADDLKSATSKKSMGLDTLEQAAEKFEKWKPHQTKSSARKGPATQELADKQAEEAAKRQELADKVRAGRSRPKPEAEEPPVAEPAPATDNAQAPAETPAAPPDDSPKDKA